MAEKMNWADPKTYWKDDLNDWEGQCVFIAGLSDEIDNHEKHGWTLLGKNTVNVFDGIDRPYVESEELILCRKSWKSEGTCNECVIANDDIAYKTECYYGYDSRLKEGWEFMGQVFNKYKVDLWRVKKEPND